MNNGHITSEKTGRGFEDADCGVLEAAAQQAHMERFKVSPAVQVCGSNRHEIDILGHYLGECVAVVFGPCFAKFLWQFAHRLFIGFGLAEGRLWPRPATGSTAGSLAGRPAARWQKRR